VTRRRLPRASSSSKRPAGAGGAAIRILSGAPRRRARARSGVAGPGSREKQIRGSARGLT
jgi:hypothetical protein